MSSAMRLTFSLLLAASMCRLSASCSGHHGHHGHHASHGHHDHNHDENLTLKASFAAANAAMAKGVVEHLRDAEISRPLHNAHMFAALHDDELRPLRDVAMKAVHSGRTYPEQAIVVLSVFVMLLVPLSVAFFTDYS